MRRPGRKFLIAALVASVLLHALFALTVRQSAPLEERPEFVTFAKRTIIRMLPKQAPHRTVRVFRSKAPLRNVSPPHLTSASVPGRHGSRPAAPAEGALGPARVLASPAPSPSPTAGPPIPRPVASDGGCTRPDAPAAVAAQGVVPALPPEARAKQTNGVSAVTVKLDETGRVLDATVASTSGNTSLDLAAVAMARGATYSPAYRACKAVATEYTFTAKFTGW